MFLSRGGDIGLRNEKPPDQGFFPTAIGKDGAKMVRCEGL
jgi:hypothetical protein